MIRRFLVGFVLIVAAVPVGATVPGDSPNGQTVVALVMLGAGAYLAATSTVVDHSPRPRRRGRSTRS